MELSETTQDSDDGILFIGDNINCNCWNFCFWGIIFIYFWLRLLIVPNHEECQRELSCRFVAEIPKRWICYYYASKLLFSTLNGVFRLESDNAHHLQATDTLWADWESFSKSHESFETSKRPSRYVIKAIVCYETSYSDNVVIEFSNLVKYGVGHGWTKDRTCMKKWVVCRGAFSMGRQLLEEAFRKEWYRSPSDSQLHQEGRRMTPKTMTTAGSPGASLGQYWQKWSNKDEVGAATLAAVLVGLPDVPRRRRGPGKASRKRNHEISNGTPRGVPKSSNVDSGSSDLHAPTSGSEVDVNAPACRVGPGGWREGPGEAPDAFILSCRLCRCKVCCAAIAGWMLRC
jgi:hypothetical protein